MFERKETGIPGLCVLAPRVWRDARGFFLETYHAAQFAELGIHDRFVQDNHSRSVKNVLRGLHYQLRRPQAKLCRVIRGAVLDVAVDIRRGSPTFGHSAAVELSAENMLQVYVPAGFAHGFVVLSDEAEFLYKCSDFYDAADERGVLWNDPDLNLNWGLSDPLLSDKDRRNPRLSQIAAQHLPAYNAP